MWDNRDMLNTIYDWATFTLANGQTNYDVKTNQAALFANVPVARKIVIDTTRNISVRLNRTSLPAIALDAGSSPMELKEIVYVQNIYLTNASGGDSTIRILLV